MPQLNRGGIFVFGLSVINPDLTYTSCQALVAVCSRVIL